MEFYKYHALGNDYIVIDPRTNDVEMTPRAIQQICHRHFGIGSDGILYGPLFESEKIGLRIFNPDGSEAEKSGNGVRIFSRYLVEHHKLKTTSFSLQTLGGEVLIQVMAKDGSLIRADMGKVTFSSTRIPVAGPSRQVIDEAMEIDQDKFRVTCVSIGNPHCVVPMDSISPSLALELGPKLEHHPMFPNRVNVQLLKVIDRKTIEIEIWERGAGYTLASGSSSCAAASAAHRLGWVDEELSVHMPGGTIEIEIQKNRHVFMQGEVASVSSGTFSHEFHDSLTGLD